MALRSYETLFILDPDVPEDDIDKELEKVREYIEKTKGDVVEFEKWGVRRLAYEINKKRQGFYVLMKFMADPSSIQDVESSFELDQNILRHIIVRREEQGNH